MKWTYIVAGAGAATGVGLLYLLYKKGYLAIPSQPTPPPQAPVSGAEGGGTQPALPPTELNPSEYGFSYDPYKLVLYKNGVYWMHPVNRKMILISLNTSRFSSLNNCYGVYFPSVQAFLHTTTFKPYMKSRSMPAKDTLTGTNFRNTLSGKKIAEYVYKMQRAGSNVYRYEGWWGRGDNYGGHTHCKITVPLITTYQIFAIEIHGYAASGTGFNDPRDIHIRNIVAYKDGSKVYSNSYGPDSPHQLSLNVYTDRIDLVVGVPYSWYNPTETRKFVWKVSISYMTAPEKDRDMIPC